ncbi:MAG: dUTP diphosphatase [Clostridia bacterium]|nr:dUTP diphosphatase [Clostridia bacterium]
MQKVAFVKVREWAKEPTYGSAGAAGADLCACLNTNRIEIAPGETVMVPTGIAVAIPEGLVGLIAARSGISVKRGLAPANKIGVIDCDYRGELLVALYNQSGKVQTVENGERIAQLLLMPYITADFAETEQLDETVRGICGFGSTGK